MLGVPAQRSSPTKNSQSQVSSTTETTKETLIKRLLSIKKYKMSRTHASKCGSAMARATRKTIKQSATGTAETVVGLRALKTAPKVESHLV